MAFVTADDREQNDAALFITERIDGFPQLHGERELLRAFAFTQAARFFERGGKPPLFDRRNVVLAGVGKDGKKPGLEGRDTTQGANPLEGGADSILDCVLRLLAGAEILVGKTVKILRILGI